MMLFRAVLILSLLAVACSSSEPEKKKQQTDSQPDYPNLVSLNPPNDQKTAPSNVYIDSVKRITHNQKNVLLISGNMANGCTYLENASHTASGDSVNITIKAWKPADKMCTQAMVPFSYIYDEMNNEQMQQFTEISVNEKIIKVGQE